MFRLDFGALLTKTDTFFESGLFIKLDKSGILTFNLTKHEMGQGSATGLAMVVAEEMDADWDKVKIEHPDFDPKYGVHMGDTGGSDSIISMWEPLRLAGATAKDILIRAAAKQWNVKPDECFARNSAIIHNESSRQLDYGELVAIASTLKPAENVSLKKPGDFQYIGKSMNNMFNKKFITGSADYTINVRVPGMVYAAIARCPVYQGKLIDFDDAEARKLEGVIDVFGISVPRSEKDESDTFHVQDGVVVVANSTWTAFEAKKMLQINWDFGEHKNASIEGLRKQFSDEAKTHNSPVYERGAFESLAGSGDHRVIEAKYESGYQTHSLMEPLNATAHYKGDSCEAWVSCQNPSHAVQEMAIILDLPEDKITLHRHVCGGSFGRRLGDFSKEVAFIAKRVKKPVKLTWSREDDVRHDHYHPFQQSIHKAIISNENKIIGWGFKGIKTIDWLVGVHSWEIPYEFPHIRTEHSPRVKGIVKDGAWRSVATHPSSFGKECFIDEIAHELNQDPIDLRLELLPAVEERKDEPDFDQEWMTFQRDRYRAILNEVKKSGVWEKGKLKKGLGQGFAIERLRRGFCAYVAKVEIKNEDIKVREIHSFVHAGRIVNPRLSESQIEGSIIWSLSALLYGGVEVEKGQVTRSNFHNNKVLRIDEIPEISVRFIGTDEDPKSIGEPGVPPLAPAVANAIFNATGKRLRTIPINLKG